MIARGWRQELRLWLPALLLLVANVMALGVYRVFLAGDAQARERRVERARADYSRIVARRERAESLVVQAGRNQHRLERLYKSRFQTEEQRITNVIAEVKDLARRAGLDPPTISYPDQTIKNFGLVKRSIVFGVDGTYLALRRFINFLELTESFVTLEEIRPSDSFDGRNSRLSISLRLSTLFLADDVDPALLARSQDALEGAP
jgi:Tfp pilus assembly protein PilO